MPINSQGLKIQLYSEKYKHLLPGANKTFKKMFFLYIQSISEVCCSCSCTLSCKISYVWIGFGQFCYQMLRCMKAPWQTFWNHLRTFCSLRLNKLPTVQRAVGFTGLILCPELWWLHRFGPKCWPQEKRSSNNERQVFIEADNKV